MKGQSRVSVVIPAFNAGSFIGAALDSLVAQTHRPMSIMVVDDGSTDGTAEVVKAYDDVRYVRQEHAGVAAARNHGVRLSRGKYIAFLDSDDLWHPQKLALQVSIMEENPSAGIVGASARTFTDERMVQWSELPGSVPVRQVPTPRFFLRNVLTTSSVLTRRSAVRQAGGFDTDLTTCEDWDLWWRIALQWQVMRVSVPLVAHRRRAGSLSSDAQSMLKSHRRVLQKIFARNPDLPWHLKQRARSYMHADAALEYGPDEARAGLRHMLRSIALWPAPMGHSFCRPLIRIRCVISLAREIVRGALEK